MAPAILPVIAVIAFLALFVWRFVFNGQQRRPVVREIGVPRQQDKTLLMQLRVGVIPTVMPYLIAPRIREFLDWFPEVQLSLIEEPTPQLIQKLQSGDLDLAVSGLPVRNPDIVCSELFREPLFLAIARGHPLSEEEKIDLRDLRKERLLLLKEGHCLREDALMTCTRQIEASFRI